MRSRGLAFEIFLTLCGLGWVLVGSCAVAVAQDAPQRPLVLPDLSEPCAPDVAPPRRAEAQHEGVDGFWFEGHVARCMLSRLTLLDRLSSRVRLLEERYTLSSDRDARQRRLVALADEAASRATEAHSVVTRRWREAEEALNVWYRHPLFLVTVGAVAIIALEIAAFLIYQEVVP